jgi:hypothetical protein
MMRRFPTMVDDMMRQRVPLGAAGEPVAGRNLGEAVARQGVVLDAAEQAGAQVPTGPAVASARQLIERVRGSGLKVNQRVRLLEKELDTFIDDNAPNLTPNQANDLVKALQEEVEAVFAAGQKGTFIKGGQRLVTKMQARIESEMRKALRQSVPGIEKAKRATQAAMAAKEGVAHSKVNIAKGVPARIPMVPTAVRAFLPDELRGIELWSRLGLGMNDPRLLALLRQSPRAGFMPFDSATMPPDTLR